MGSLLLELPGGGYLRMCAVRGVKGTEVVPLCCVCRQRTREALCDGPSPTPGSTCDAPLCKGCAQHVDPDKDFCPAHRTPEQGELELLMRKAKPCTESVPCSSCQRPVLWARWHTGKHMPVDASPLPTGDLVLTHHKSTNTLSVQTFKAESHGPGRNRYTSHFATCEHSDQHRKGRLSATQEAERG